MSKPKSSTKRAKYVCAVCDTKKPPTHFPDSDAAICSDCTIEMAKAMADAQNTEEDIPAPPKAVRTPSLRVKSTPADQEPPKPAPGSTPEDGAPVAAGEVFSPPNPEKGSVDPSSAELAARTLARRRLMAFIRRYRPKYLAGWVHDDICRRLERFMKDVEEGKEPRLLIMVPVRHGKSEICSRHFAPWVLGHHPDWEIIAASGAQNLAMSFSRYIRDLVRDPSFQALFPHMRLDPSSQSVENWNTTYGGGYLAAGIGTMITGRGAHILLIDDPVKDAEAADSATIRDSVWEWYMSTALTRLAPGGGVLGVLTWWNDDDWAGRIQQVMATGDGDKFEIVKYPAINETGDEYLLADDTIIEIPPGAPVPEGAQLTRPHNTALHPARYTLESLLRRKANYYALGQQRWWSALYQQNPTPEEGTFFTKEMLVEYSHAPQRAGRMILQAWDFAITTKQTSDWTVGITGLLDEHDSLYILDVWRFKTDDGIELGTAIVEYAAQFKADLLAVEDGQIWKSIKSNFDKAAETKKYYPSYEVIVPLTDKRTRAQPARGRMQQKKVQFRKHAPWYPTLKSELLRFEGGGKHDDQVDALAHLVRLATAQAAPKGPPKPKEPESWRKKLNAHLKGLGSHMAARVALEIRFQLWALPRRVQALFHRLVV